MLRNVREVLTDKNYKVNREIVRANLELSLKENPWAKHKQCSTKPSLTRKEIKTKYGHRGVRFRSPSSQKLTQREETVACEMCGWVSRECAKRGRRFFWRFWIRYVGPSRHSFLSRFGPTSESEAFGAVDVDHTVTRLLNPEFVRADLHVILELQQTSSWNAEEMHVP